jgi:hypothetical protein
MSTITAEDRHEEIASYAALNMAALMHRRDISTHPPTSTLATMAVDGAVALIRELDRRWAAAQPILDPTDPELVPDPEA